MTVPELSAVAFRPGRCALCDDRVDDDATMQVQLRIIAAAGVVSVQCWLCPECLPTPGTVSATTGHLLGRVLGCYRAMRSVCPALALVTGD